MSYDAPENTGKITLKMLQDAFSETMKQSEHTPMVILCKPDEYPQVKEWADRIFGK